MFSYLLLTIKIASSSYVHTVSSVLDDAVEDMDDAVGGEDVKLDDVGGASAGCDGDGLGVPVHGDLLAAQALEGCAALGHVLGLKKRKQT